MRTKTMDIDNLKLRFMYYDRLYNMISMNMNIIISNYILKQVIESTKHNMV